MVKICIDHDETYRAEPCEHTASDTYQRELVECPDELWMKFKRAQEKYESLRAQIVALPSFANPDKDTEAWRNA